MAHHLGVVATLLLGYAVLLLSSSLSSVDAVKPPDKAVVAEAPGTQGGAEELGQKSLHWPPWNSYPCPAIAEIPSFCPKPKDCAEVQALGYSQSGVYTVYVGPYDWKVDVYCDMVTKGGGWLVFQRRHDGFTDFFRLWNEYADGFGNLHGEFWLGNHFINLISQQKNYRMRVDMEDFDGATAYAEYTTFKVAAPHLKYKLAIGGYSGFASTGTMGDAMAHHNDRKFSTRDQENDAHGTVDCANVFKAGWWFGTCHDSNLNGLYHGGYFGSSGDGVSWQYWKGDTYSLKTTVMMMRPL